jgi:peptide subunit release factor 1 (eRF1)
MLFNMIVLPYIDQNRRHAKGLCDLIEYADDGIWDRKLLDYFTSKN